MTSIAVSKHFVVARLLGCLTLLGGLMGGSVLGLGTTPQTLTWHGTTNDILATGLAYPLTASASSGLPVTVRVVAGPATVAQNGTITVSAAGTVWVAAEQAGDATYAPAGINRSFNVRQFNLTPVGGIALGGSPWSVSVVGNYAYLAADGAGLQVIDVSSPDQPRWTGELKLAGRAWGVHVVGSIAYLAYGPTGLQIINVAKPDQPDRTGRYGAPGFATGVHVVGKYAYLAAAASGLQIIDLTDSVVPTRTGWLETGGQAYGVQVVGNYAYVADWYGGLQVIDVSAPATPKWTGGYVASEVSGVQVVGKYAYVADGTSGLLVLDVSKPARPVRIGGTATGDRAFGLQVVGTNVYVADRNAGLQVVDITDPANPLRVGGSAAGGDVVAVQVVGKYAYVADTLRGLRIFEAKTGYAQTLEFKLPAELPASALPVASVVVSNRGLPPTLSVVSGPATVANGRLTFTGVGAVVLRADQAGNGTFLPASAQWTVAVTLPRLNLRLVTGKPELYWAAGIAGLQLQGREALSAGSPWQSVMTAPIEAGGEARVPLDAAASLRYFRLLNP